MKKHETNTSNEFEWVLIETPSKTEEKEEVYVSKNRIFEDTIAPSVLAVAKKIMVSLQKPLTALRYQIGKMASGVGVSQNIKDNLESLLQNKNIPWMKIGLVAFAGFILMKKDLRLNFDLSAPFAAFADDDSNSESTNYTQSVANFNAPVSASALSDSEVQSFVKRYAPIAISEMEKFGIPASIKIGQALIESRAGTSRLATKNNNYFGIKCFSKNCKKGHCSNATDDHHKDFFRNFDNPMESFRAHSALLSNNRYESLKAHKGDYTLWAKGLKNKGYATDKNYPKKLISVIEKYKLYKLDDF